MKIKVGCSKHLKGYQMRDLKVLLPTIFIVITTLSFVINTSIAFPITRTAMAATSSSSTSSSLHMERVIDSHLHIWATASESGNSQYAYAVGQAPPDSIIDDASPSKLLQKMKAAKVDGALIVQPINHLFNHRYVADAIKKNPSKFKGMMLHDPSLSAEDAVQRLDDLALQGFVGVRFNPYLWPTAGKCMSKKGQGGLAVYKRCGELKFPVGIMCFKGLDLHYEDIVDLLETFPDTTMILDHLGFTALDGGKDNNFTKLLALAKYPNLVVKISAMFRVAADDPYPYERVRNERFLPLLRAYGKDRIMFGTDFPFIIEQEGSYEGAVNLVKLWAGDDETRRALMSGTAERLFGQWG